MHNQSFTPSYSELTTALEEALLQFEAAQTHGVLCGFICAAPESSNWEKLLLGKTNNLHTIELLQELHEAIYHQMSEFSFEFALLLPDDAIDINIRTETLGLWCQGFLAGLKQAGVESISDEMTEALADITEIANVTYGDIAENDEEEMAYFELVEYVRLAALMIYQELRDKKLPDIENGNGNDQLH